MNDDLISRAAAIEAVEILLEQTEEDADVKTWNNAIRGAINSIKYHVPSAQQTLYGYNIEHLELIARVLQKEDLPPERIVEALTDIGRIVAIVKDEFEEALRKAVEQCMI
jgi:hypothetical protein